MEESRADHDDTKVVDLLIEVNLKPQA